MRQLAHFVPLFIPFTTSYFSSYSGRELARQAKMSHQTVSRYLLILLKQGVFTKKVHKGYDLYSLNLLKEQTRQFMKMAECLKAMSFEHQLLIDEIIPHCRTLIIYGSHAKGLAKKDSDIDMVVIDGSKPKIIKVLSRFPFTMQVDYVSTTRWISQENTPLGKEICAHHLVYGDMFVIDRWVGVF